MQSFRVPQVFVNFYFHRRFSLDLSTAQGTGGRWRLSQGEDLGALQKERDIAHHLFNLNQQVTSEIVGSCSFFQNHSSWRECPSAFLGFWKKVSIIWAPLPTGTLYSCVILLEITVQGCFRDVWKIERAPGRYI